MSNYILPPEFVYGRIADGNAYLVPALLNIPAGESRNVHIRNPHTDKVMWFAAIRIVAEGSNTFHIHDDFDSVTNGTEITVQNALMDEEGGAPDSGPFVAHKNSTYTSNQSYPVGFTETGGPTETNSIDIISSAMEPNREIVFEISNTNSSSQTAFFGALILTSY